MSNLFIYQGDVIGKPRMTQSDRWKRRECVDRYYSFKDSIVLQAKKENFILGNDLSIVVGLKMPESWSKKKKSELLSKPHQSKPDIDNICKAIFDSLKDKDQTIYSVTIKKFWSNESSIIIVNNEV